jgi:hypothetical protein
MFPGLFGGIVINATWDAIEPTQGGAPDFSTVDAALTQVRTYNAQNAAAPLGVKLRVYQGANAPAWAKAIDGGPVNIVRNPAGCPSGSCPLTVGKFWSANYIAAWRDFQATLAAKYDDEPLIKQVAITSCAPQTDEPFVPTVDPTAKAAQAAAGYTDDAEKACLTGALDDYAAWKNTLLDFTFNTFTNSGLDDGGAGTDPTFTTGLMNTCRSQYPARCVLDNHALSAPLRAADDGVYTAMPMLKAPVNFQTQAPKGFGCLWLETIEQGIALGANAIEVWPGANYGGFDALTSANIQQLAKLFTTPVPVPTPLPAAACPTFN